MKEELVSFETAKLAKEKGFNIFIDSWYNKDGEECFVEHSDYCFSDYFSFKELDSGELITEDEIYSAPTQSLLQKWLREKHKLFVYVLDDDRIGKYYWGVSNLFSSSENPDFNTYEEALEVGLQQALKFIK